MQPSVLDADQITQLCASLPAVEGSGSRTLLTIAQVRETAVGLRTLRPLATVLQQLVAVQAILFRKTRQHNWSVRPHRDAILPMQGRGSWPGAGRKEGRDSVHVPREFMDRCVVVRVHLDGTDHEDVSVVPGS
ncbi:MAG: hypothetical protein AAFX85_19235, partial [Pseudomonadota bacterium]